MKRFCVVLAAFIFFFSFGSVFAQNADDIPYLSEADIAAIEMVLPDDVPAALRNEPAVVVQEVKNEITRLNTSQPVYHLLVLDRLYCRLDSDISDVGSLKILYKYKHGRNGYLIAVYMSTAEGPVFPQLPAKSRIILDFVSGQKNTIRNYVTSSAFRRYVTNQRVLADLQRVL